MKPPRILQGRDRRSLDNLFRAVKPEWLAGAAMENATVLGWGDPVRGCFVLIPEGDACAVHVAVLPEHRGREALRMARWALAWCRSTGVRLIGRTPDDNRAAKWFALASGMKFVDNEDGNMRTES